VPRPRISAANVSIANPAWSSSPQLASVGSIVVALHPLPLLHKEVVITTDLAVDKVNVDAERRADGSNNWTFKDNGPATWRSISSA
jgi:uncharacterized protein involved in outer membrane biogenesis